MRLLLDTGVVGQVHIAAQAIAEQAVVVTTNPRHFEALVRASKWDELGSEAG